MSSVVLPAPRKSGDDGQRQWRRRPSWFAGRFLRAPRPAHSSRDAAFLPAGVLVWRQILAAELGGRPPSTMRFCGRSIRGRLLCGRSFGGALLCGGVALARRLRREADASALPFAGAAAAALLSPSSLTTCARALRRACASAALVSSERARRSCFGWPFRGSASCAGARGALVGRPLSPHRR